MKLIWVHPLAAMKGGERQIHDKKLLMFGFFHTLKRMSQKCSHSVRFWDTFLDKKEENRSSFGIIESPQPYQRKDGFLMYIYYNRDQLILPMDLE
ncbi:hypothetical protein, partial [Saccharococcus caldoxylosilyticus]|uniref:hypothetical protein n=1 Tax=Saccharococcus caldoxylosilyticus TaxID=81408 RepID=UPI001C85165A